MNKLWDQIFEVFQDFESCCLDDAQDQYELITALVAKLQGYEDAVQACKLVLFIELYPHLNSTETISLSPKTREQLSQAVIAAGYNLPVKPRS